MPLVPLFLLVLVLGAAPGLASECLEFRLASYFTPDMVLQSREARGQVRGGATCCDLSCAGGRGCGGGAVPGPGSASPPTPTPASPPPWTPAAGGGWRWSWRPGVPTPSPSPRWAQVQCSTAQLLCPGDRHQQGRGGAGRRAGGRGVAVCRGGQHGAPRGRPRQQHGRDRGGPRRGGGQVPRPRPAPSLSPRCAGTPGCRPRPPRSRSWSWCGGWCTPGARRAAPRCRSCPPPAGCSGASWPPAPASPWALWRPRSTGLTSGPGRRGRP